METAKRYFEDPVIVTFERDELVLDTAFTGDGNSDGRTLPPGGG
jgi:hypothetical protein